MVYGLRVFTFNNMSPVIQCKRCILDTGDDPNLKFDNQGVCNYCNYYDSLIQRTYPPGFSSEKKFQEIIDTIKREGKGKKYDTILGVSGGVDSTYLAYLAKQHGLRVLLFHFDNGWNSEMAVKNIESLSQILDFDLHTYVVDWNEFKDIQLSYIKASVVDIEAITDHSAILATKRLARKYRIKNVIIGTNIATESILPRYWYFPKNDWRNLKDIHKRYGSVPIKSLPVSSIFEDFYYKNLYTIHLHSLLDYIPYIKSDVKRLIIEKLNWQDYGGKHYESIWTRFYQGYILPKKFNIDKRKAHLSNLICSGQITKEEALKEMEKPIYDAKQLKIDKEFVLKKFLMTEDEFDNYIKLPRIEHTTFDYIKPLDIRYPFLKPLKALYRSIFSMK